MSNRELVDKSVANIFWAYLSFFCTKVLNLLATIVLARLLGPAEFGLMAFCLVIIAYFEIFSRFGLGAALISAADDPGETAQTADAVFFYSVLLSAVAALALWLGAGQIAAFFEQPQLAALLGVLCIAMVIDAASTVNNSMLQRELRFRLKVLPDIVRGVVKAVVSIALAFLDFGVWSLVYGHLAGMIAFTAMVFVVQAWRPRALPRWDTSKRVLRFGVSLLGAEFINMSNRNLPTLMIGKILGAAPLGLFNLAQRIPDLAIKSFSLVSTQVTHPIMARMQTDKAALRQYFYGCLRYFGLLTFPGGVAIAVMADPLVVILYPPVWYEMIVPMQFLSIAFALHTVNLLPGSIYKAINRPGYLLQVSLANLPILVLVMWITVPMGLNTVSAAQVLLAVLFFVPNYIVLRNAIQITTADCFKSLIPGFVCGLVTGVAGLAIQQVVTGPPVAELLATMVFAGGAYVVTLYLVGPEVISEATRIVAKRWRRRAH